MLSNIIFSLLICSSYNRDINKQQKGQWKGSDEEGGTTISPYGIWWDMMDGGLDTHSQASCSLGAQAWKSTPHVFSPWLST